MSSSATYLAFGSIVKRSLTTFTTPTRISPRPIPFIPPYHTLVSKASKARKLPKNHFTSHRPRFTEEQPHQQHQHKHHDGNEKKQKGPKRKAAQRTQAGTSLRRVAVEAQRSRGSLIKGKGKLRHVDPEAETKDVTAYCAAETYNVHVARDILRKDGGWREDPWNTALFPQVLHVQTAPQPGEQQREESGDVFVFPSGSVVAWNVDEKAAHRLVERTLLPAAETSHLDRLEAEDLEYLEDATQETSEIIGDTIILGTKAPSPEPSDQHNHPQQQRQDKDTILAKIAFSSALARSTKLAVLENRLAHYFRTTHHIPTLLASGRAAFTLTRGLMLRKTGELLQIRAHLNLYSELTDSLPDLFWDSPHELGLENYYEHVSRVLDVGVRIKVLNERMDYASEIARVLRERLSERHGHLLEWIIIWLILVEVVYGSWHLWCERCERVDPRSTTNLVREFLARELGRE